jgi:hypothetical protein
VRDTLAAMLFWIALLAPHAQASDTDLATAIESRLTPSPQLRGTFTQDKQVAGFTRPLRSTGSFLWWQGHGLLWQTEQPFAGTLVLTPTALRSTSPDGGDVVLDAHEQPGLAMTSQLLFDLLGGDVRALEQRFEVTGEVPAHGRWSLDLQPRDRGLKEVLQRVHLEGEATVQSVQLDEANGDRTHIAFADPRTEPAASADERALLAD